MFLAVSVLLLTVQPITLGAADIRVPLVVGIRYLAIHGTAPLLREDQMGRTVIQTLLKTIRTLVRYFVARVGRVMGVGAQPAVARPMLLLHALREIYVQLVPPLWLLLQLRVLFIPLEHAAPQQSRITTQLTENATASMGSFNAPTGSTTTVTALWIVLTLPAHLLLLARE